MTDVFLAYQGPAPANTNKTWNNIQTGSSGLGLNDSTGGSTGLSLTAASVTGAIEIAVDVNSVPTGDAAPVDELPIARWGHYKNSSTEWASYTITGGTPNAPVTYYSFCSAGFGRLTEIRVNGGTSQTQDSNVNKTEVLVFNANFDGSGNLVIEHRQGSGSSGSAYQNAGWLSYGAAADTTPPTFTSAPAVTNTTESGHSIAATLNEAGTVYGIRMTNGATAPADDTEFMSLYDGGVTGDVLEVASEAASNSATLVFSTGSASTAYDYYILAEDDDGTPNVQATPTLVEATTAASQVPGISGYTLSIDGVQEGNLSNVEVVVLAGTTLDGVKQLYSATESATAGVLNDIDLSATTIGVGDSYTMTVRVPDGENITVTSTASDIA